MLCEISRGWENEPGASALTGYVLIGDAADRKITSAVIEFLQSGAFQLIPEDYVKRKGKRGFAVCESQGTPMLRKVARMASRRYLEILSPSILRRARKFQERNFRILQLKRLGHALNLDGIIRLSDGSITQYNGFSEAFSIPMIASSLREYAKNRDSLISKANAAWAAGALIGCSSHDIHYYGEGKILRERVLHQEIWDPVAISSGYDWHSTLLFFFRGFFIYCNRGAGCDPHPGIVVFRIPDLDLVTPEILDGLILRHQIGFKKWFEHYHISSLIQSLKMELVFYQKQKKQKTGTCTYISVKSGVRALLAMKYMMDNFNDRAALTAKDWEEAFNETKEMYKRWSHFDRRLVLEDFLIDAHAIPEQKAMITSEELRKISLKIRAKISEKKEKYQSILKLFENV